jgi:hypothetical protein
MCQSAKQLVEPIRFELTTSVVQLKGVGISPGLPELSLGYSARLR